MAIDGILRNARDMPSRTAAVQDSEVLSYREFALRIARVRAQLADQGLQPGDVAVICVNRTLDAWILGFALRSLGLATLVAIDAERIGQRGLDRALVVALAGEPRPLLRQRARQLGWRLLLLPECPPAAATDFETLVRSLDNPKSGGHIMLTSGTTGEHKAVLRDATRESLLIPLHARINGIDADSVVFASSFGLWTAGGYRWPLITWAMGGTVVFDQGREPHRSLQAHAFTHMFSTPAMLADLLDGAGDALPRKPDMRLLVTGGEMPRKLARSVRERLTPRLYSVLASTEALTVAITPIESDEDLHWHRLHPEREVQVVGEDGRVLPQGQVGRVRVRILDGLDGYWHDEAATREFFQDGWFYPGDLGVFDLRGRLGLQGRSSDVVNVRGDKIATTAIERRLCQRFDVDAVCLLNVHREGGDDELHIVIESGQPLSPAQCRAAIAEDLGLLRGVHLHFDLIDRLPRNGMGKVQRDVLRQQLLTRNQRLLLRSDEPD